MYPQLKDMSECWKHIKDTTSTHTHMISQPLAENNHSYIQNNDGNVNCVR